MLGSNQRPLPCEGRSITPWLFADVQKHLQNCAFYVTGSRACSPLFVWVGVLLVYTNFSATPALSYLCVVSRLLRYARRGRIQRRASPHGSPLGSVGCPNCIEHKLHCFIPAQATAPFEGATTGGRVVAACRYRGRCPTGCLSPVGSGARFPRGRVVCRRLRA